ncbi:MAG: ATP-binding protein [Campylobacteraceae bacterium]|nr:ATP-binding protein [Campylobacteraceae bacterium]
MVLEKKIIKIAKKNGGFFEYTTVINPITRKSEKKISYISGIKEWHWAIETGEYISDIDKIVVQKQKELKSTLRQTLIKLGIVFTFIGILLILLLLLIIKKSEKVFLNYKNMILNETNKNKNYLLMMQNQNKLAAMGEMLGNISHQWKQPLNTLGISISKMMLLEETGKLTKKIMLESFDRIEKNIEYLSQTIDVFRDFFKPVQSVEKFYLKKEIKNMVYITQDSFNDRKIELSYKCEDGIYILGDKKKLEQVFINILNNAKDAIVENNIDKAKVYIKSYSQVNMAIITIQDNALGVKDEIKDKIFEPYFTTKSNNQGTGVGLYMSKVIIENNFQGSLTFENRDGGARFIISIPQVI